METLLFFSASLSLLFLLPCPVHPFLYGTVTQYSAAGANDTATCGGRICLNEASCVEGRCQCPHNDGDGSLYCYNSTNLHCSVLNDPKLENFHGERLNLPTPCKVKLLKYNTFKPNIAHWSTSATGLNCHVLVSSYGHRVLGKIFVGGFSVLISVREGRTNILSVLRLQAFGEVDVYTNEYIFQARLRLNGTWMDANNMVNRLASPVPYVLEINPSDNKVLFLQVATCGFSAIFRPPHPDQGANQVRVPGLALFVDPDTDATGEIQWPAGCAHTLCLYPGGPTMESIRQANNVTTLEAAALSLCFLSTSGPDSVVPAVCEASESAIKNCQNNFPNATNTIFERCSHLLSHEVLVRCLSRDVLHSDPQGSVIVSWFYKCVTAICEANSEDCAYLRGNITLTEGCATQAADWELTSDFCDNLPVVTSPW